MKISEITLYDVVQFLRLEEGAYDDTMLSAIMAAATKYIEGHTGIPSAAENGETLDDYDDLYIAYMVLCQDMYDNRTMYPDNSKYNSNSNVVVDSILSLHARNLL